MKNDSERMQPKGCKKTNEKLILIQKYYDTEKTKPWKQYHFDQFGKWRGEYKSWFEDGKIHSIVNFKDGKVHGKYQYWWWDGRRFFVDTNHFKKREHGTKIEFKYKK